jgi:hypothetical protein
VKDYGYPPFHRHRLAFLCYSWNIRRFCVHSGGVRWLCYLSISRELEREGAKHRLLESFSRLFNISFSFSLISPLDYPPYSLVVALKLYHIFRAFSLRFWSAFSSFFFCQEAKQSRLEHMLVQENVTSFVLLGGYCLPVKFGTGFIDEMILFLEI